MATTFKSLITGRTLVYTEKEQIGKGVYGTVKSYVDEKGATLSVKVSVDEDHNSAMLREIAILLSLQSPEKYVVEVLDAFVTDEGLYGFVYPYAQTDLKTYIADWSPSYLNQKDVMYQIGTAISFIQSRGVLNADYKSFNILIYIEKEPDGSTKPRVSIIDFGLAKVEGKSRTTDETFTLWWRAPELLMGGTYTASADAWALGMIWCEVLTGTPPFRGDSEIDQLYKYFKQFGTPTEKTWPGVSTLSGFNANWPKFPVLKKRAALSALDGTTYRLISQLLRMDPNTRATIKEVLADPYFVDVFTPLMVSTPIDIFPKPQPAPDINCASLTRKWMSDVCRDFRMVPCTESLAMAIFEESRRKMEHTVRNLQPCACGSIYIASVVLYDDVDLADLSAVTNKAFSVDAIRKCVNEILASCSFAVYKTTSYDVLIKEIGSVSRTVAADALTLLQLTYSTGLSSTHTVHQIASMCLSLAKVLDGATRTDTRALIGFAKVVAECASRMKSTELKAASRMDCDPVWLAKRMVAWIARAVSERE